MGKLDKYVSGLTEPRAMVLLAMLSVLLYANTLGHEYAQDDAIAITENEFTTRGIQGIPDLWRYDSFRGFFKEEGKDRLVTGGRYRPLSLTFFALERSLFGPSPLVGHFFNVLTFCLLVLLLFAWLQHLLPASRFGIAALAGTVLFAAHPIHTEVVANIKGRDEILALLLAVLAGYFFTKKNRPWLAAICLFFALTAKEIAVTALIWVPLAALLLQGERVGRVARKAGIMATGLVGYMALRISVIGAPGLTSTSNELMNNPFLRWTGNSYVPFTTVEWLFGVLRIQWEYLRLLFFPLNLSHDYYPRALPIGSSLDPWAWLGALSLIALVIVALRFKRHPLPAWCAVGYLAGFAIVGNLLFPIGTLLGERFMFTPSLFACLAIAALVIRVAPTRATWILALITLLFCVKTIQRNTVWANDETLFLHDVQYQPNSAKLRNAAGGTLLENWPQKAHQPDAKKNLTRAIDHLTKAIDIHPRYKHAWAQLGNAHFYAQDYEKAVEAYLTALKIDPEYDLAAGNLAVCYREYGKRLGEREGRIDDAIRYLSSSVEINPSDAEAQRLLGVALGMSGQTTQARIQFEKVIELEPNNAHGWYNLGIALGQMGETEAAREAISKAKKLDPDQYGKPE
jgi:protein O-mannosyl-transferase